MTGDPALLSPPVVRGALVVAGVAVGLLVSFQRPTGGRTAVLASLPWVAVGAALHALRGIVDYPATVVALLGFPWAYLLAGTIGGLGWVLLTSVVDPEARAVCPHYFGVTGLGVLLVLTTVLVVKGAAFAPALIALWLTLPLVAILVTYVVLIGLGLWLPDAGYFAGRAGAAVIFGLALDGAGTALAFEFGARIEPPFGIPAGAAGPLLGPAAHPLVVAWTVVWLRLVLAVAVIVGLTALARTRPRAAERGLELTTVLAVVVAANTFLFALGGWFA